MVIVHPDASGLSVSGGAQQRPWLPLGSMQCAVERRVRDTEPAGCGPNAGPVRDCPSGGPQFLVTQRAQATMGVDASLAQPLSEG